MQRREWHDLPRSRDLPAGPWDDEPDKVQWPSDTGLACMIRRGPMGNWCGYVGLDETHPLYSKGGYDFDLDVHGGVTYTALCDGDEEAGICHVPGPGEPEPLWWIGFDCGHWSDLIPSMPGTVDPGGTYRDLAYVTAETERLATQLAAIR